MKKIKTALYEINFIDNLSRRNHWINSIHPMVKLIVTVVYIITVVSTDKYNLAGLLLMGVYPIVIFILGELSFIDSIKRLRFIIPFVFIVGIFNPFFDKKILFNLGEITITTGMISMVTLILKGFFSILASYLLIATTSIEKICYALRLLQIPEVIVTQVLLTYRYINLLIKETNKIIQAYSLRAPKQKGIHFKVWGSLTGMLLLRSIDRASEVYSSMIIRGYRGEFYYENMKICKEKDYIYLFLWLCIIGILKFIPVIIYCKN